MLIGTMNHPEHDVLAEIAWMADAGMEFIDLTLEPPAAASWEVDTRAIRAALERSRMPVVGHTAWYLPMASAIPEIRAAAVAELRRCLYKFAEVGARWMNIHPDRHTPWHPRQFFIDCNVATIEELLPDVERSGVGLMIENLPGDYNSAPQLADLLDRVPQLGLHLDIGHANLQVPHNTTEEILAAHGKRLRHVHLHDNKGGHADLHLPLGTGTVDLRRSVQELRQCGYDGTITLEVFTPDRHHLLYSRDLLRKTWNESTPTASAKSA
ncbi:MAG TPA: sugar phosphate isomerase/epimerase family protein [Bryobacteraceae bacterium]|jgi:sugar phosphate isomerase/epimerase|nr:sugar phosphate isomerase/epimerase family protein [Bryobacteraceae bacterium]